MEEFYPFESLQSALNYYVHAKPTRANYLRLEEGGKGKSERHQKFSNLDLHAQIVSAIFSTLKQYTLQQQQFFAAYHLGPRYSRSEIASWYKVSTRTVRYWIEKIEDELETKLRLQGLMPPAEQRRSA